MNSQRFYKQWKEATDAGRRLLDTRGESEFFTPIEGRNTVRILPWIVDPLSLPKHLQKVFTYKDENGLPVIDEDTKQPYMFVSSFLPISVHYNIGTDKPFTCARSFGEKCVVCTRGSQLWQTYSQLIEGKNEEEQKAFLDRKEFAKSHFATQRFFTFVLIFEDAKKPDLSTAKLKPWIFGKRVWESISEKMLETDPEDEEVFLYEDITDKDEGRVLYFNRVGRGRVGTSYNSFQLASKKLAIEPLDLTPGSKTPLVIPDFYIYLQDNSGYDEELGLKSIEKMQVEKAGDNSPSPQSVNVTSKELPDDSSIRKPNNADLLKHQAQQVNLLDEDEVLDLDE